MPAAATVRPPRNGPMPRQRRSWKSFGSCWAEAAAAKRMQSGKMKRRMRADYVLPRARAAFPVPVPVPEPAPGFSVPPPPGGFGHGLGLGLGLGKSRAGLWEIIEPVPGFRLAVRKLLDII